MDAPLHKTDDLDVSDLVRRDRVHRRVYQDPDIFDLEMERIFGRAWVFIGHESQIPNPGDFVSTFIGREPVLFCRHSDGKVYVLHNRCPHRGASVCNVASGNTGRWFRCPYHGWTFDTDGRLHAVTMRSGYGEGYPLDASEFGLAPVARVAQYEGFTFASLAPVGAPFDLPAEMKACIDCVIERAPDKAIEVTGGVHKYQFRGNWKAQIENALDHYHPPFTHESTSAQDGRQFARRVGEQAGSPLNERSRSMPGRSSWDDAQAFAFAGGHGYEGPMPGAKAEREGEIFERYKSALLRGNSKDRVDGILKNELFHNAVFYPNMNLQLRALYIRVVRPVSVNFSEVNVYPIRLKGAPDEMFREQIRFLDLTHSASSLIQTDDVEMFRRVDVGLQNSKPEWILLGRGFDSEAQYGSGVQADGTAELAMRNQFKAWAAYMSGEALAMRTGVASVENQNPVTYRDQLEAFLIHEAHLLDERKFAEWIDLFAEDGYYWAPSHRNQESPLNEVSLFYDDRAAMQTRLRRFNHPSLHSQTPIPLSARLVSNIVIEDMTEAPQVCTVRSKFMMFEYHPGVPEGEERVFGGTYTHRIVWRAGRFQMLWKKAVLANADARFGALFVYF